MSMPRKTLRRAVVAALAAVVALVPAPALAEIPPDHAEDHNTAFTNSDGDLWASCESDDGALYAANGDGTGFDLGHSFDPKTEDIVVNRIVGTPYLTPSRTGLTGRVVTRGGNQAGTPGTSVGRVWSDIRHYNRKPTGMLCVDRTLYLAVQDLRRDFSAAPAATILRSTDHGRTWHWDDSEPMFGVRDLSDPPSNPKAAFTTIFFLDYGRDSVNAPDPGVVYAYGLDDNWAGRSQLHLARIPKNSIQDRSTWQWSNGPGTWTAPGDLQGRVPVINDDSLPPGHISQGSVVYDKPLNRYLYSSWNEEFWVFYEAPTPWGPWTRLMTKNFLTKCFDRGRARWNAGYHGGYATTIPSKYISSDGRTMWVQSNVFFTDDQCPSPEPKNLGSYSFALRKLWLTTPDNLVRDPGFEGQRQFNFFGLPAPLGPVEAPWTTEGPDVKGIDVGTALPRQGTKNAWIHPANQQTRAWNAITQDVPVRQHTRYVLTGYVQTSANLTEGYFGVRAGQNVISETKFGPLGPYTRLSVTFDSGANDKVKLFTGYWAPGQDSWLRLDDTAIAPA
ncbi:hypothetical protein FHS29_004809 [Saccharothrix tamanrassetensis]|uniref:DUF4185 domain-containing protein n=1 Tax=Saccharothrix tamanrassetensis TaxID=1051531 RepID=A0A841CKZ5_9PSEU|nr:DUF4185 domain-containing protein [Saccharothrix tamanrassetensis]MBB5958201.1 hypothetical protein [Saccharothrix tamanrassetensis]